MDPKETGNVCEALPMRLLGNRKKNDAHEGAMNRY
jgi:hypothetical protein